MVQKSRIYLLAISCFAFFSCSQTGSEVLERDSLVKLIKENDLAEFQSLYFELDSSERDDNILLEEAMSLRRVDFILFILDNGTKLDFTIQNGMSQTILHDAVQFPSHQIIEKIISHKDFTSFNDSCYFDLLSYCFAKRSTPIRTIELLLKNNVHIDYTEDLIYRSAIFCQTEKVKLLLENGFKLKDDYYGEGNILEVVKKYHGY
jgi:hypothetical protein